VQLKTAPWTRCAHTSCQQSVRSGARHKPTSKLSSSIPSKLSNNPSDRIHCPSDDLLSRRYDYISALTIKKRYLCQTLYSLAHTHTDDEEDDVDNYASLLANVSCNNKAQHPLNGSLQWLWLTQGANVNCKSHNANQIIFRMLEKTKAELTWNPSLQHQILRFEMLL